MAKGPWLFDIGARLRELSAKGDDFERVNALVDFEALRPGLDRVKPCAGRLKGGRPPFDPASMLKTLILQPSHSLSDERTEYLIKDRLSFMRFLGLSLADRVPDANSICNFREALTRLTIGGSRRSRPAKKTDPLWHEANRQELHCQSRCASCDGAICG